MMNPFSWLRKSEDRTGVASSPIAEEQRERKAQLEQAVVTFERSRYNVHKTAELALQRMRENER